jgi:lipoprotein-anchoring transpeptidase ErfK/SrfK
MNGQKDNESKITIVIYVGGDSPSVAYCFELQNARVKDGSGKHEARGHTRGRICNGQPDPWGTPNKNFGHRSPVTGNRNIQRIH